MNNIRHCFITLGILTLLTGVTSVGCSASGPKAVAVQPAAEAEQPSENLSKSKPSEESIAENSASENIVSEAVNAAPSTPDKVAQPSAASDKKKNPPTSVKQYEISSDSNGDFSSALLIGHRGVYGNNQWLVMPQSDGYLNCRYTPNGEIRSEVVPSMIITAKFNGPLSTDNRQTPNPDADAIVFHEGKPWLRVAGTERASFFPPSANRSSQDYLGECYVRANSQYITDVSNDAVN